VVEDCSPCDVKLCCWVSCLGSIGWRLSTGWHKKRNLSYPVPRSTRWRVPCITFINSVRKCLYYSFRALKLYFIKNQICIYNIHREKNFLIHLTYFCLNCISVCFVVSRWNVYLLKHVCITDVSQQRASCFISGRHFFLLWTQPRDEG
jgi:hypothetical protein